MSFALIAVIVGLVEWVQGDCLASAALTSLGFTNQTKATYTNSSVCSNLWNKYGGCVDPTSVSNSISTSNNFLKNRIDDGSSFSAVFAKLQNKVLNIFGKNNVTDDNLAIQAIGTKALNARNDCLKSLALVHHGLYCLLTSGLATNLTSDIGSALQVRSNTTDVGAALDACLPIIDATCTTAYGNPISSSAVYATNNTNAVNITNQTCSALKAFSNCTTDPTCNGLRRTILIQSLFVFNEINFLPPKSTLDKIGDFYNSVLDKIKSLFSRRLQSAKTVQLVADVAGESLVVDGGFSGSAIPVASSSARVFLIGVIATLLLIFA